MTGVLGLALGLLLRRLRIGLLASITRRLPGTLGWIAAAAAATFAYLAVRDLLPDAVALAGAADHRRLAAMLFEGLVLAAAVSGSRAEDELLGCVIVFGLLGAGGSLVYALLASHPSFPLAGPMRAPFARVLELVRDPNLYCFLGPPRSITHTALALFVAASLLFGLGLVFATPDRRLGPDEEWYWQAATRLVATGEYLNPSHIESPLVSMVRAQRTPGYPLFLSAWVLVGKLLTGDGRVAPLAAQVALHATALVLAFLIAKLLSGTPAGLLSAATYFIYTPLIWHSVQLLTETLAAVLGLAAVWWALLGSFRGKAAYGAISGLSIALATLVRPPSVSLLAGAVLAPIALRGRRSAWTSVMLLVGFAAGMSPWIVRNAIVLGSPVVLSTNGGFEFWSGNDLRTMGRKRWKTYRYARELTADCTDEVERDRVLRAEGVRLIGRSLRQQPRAFLDLVAQKVTVLVWNVAEGARQQGWTRALHRAVVLLAILGMLATRRYTTALWASVGALVALHAATYGMESRFFLPAMPLAIVLASIGVSQLLFPRTRSECSADPW